MKISSEKGTSSVKFTLLTHKRSKIRAVLVDVVVGVGRLLICALRGLRDFLLRINVDDESVREDGAIWRDAIECNRGHQRALEPAAMLVGRLKIQIRGEVRVRCACVKPPRGSRRNRSKRPACRFGASSETRS